MVACLNSVAAGATNSIPHAASIAIFFTFVYSDTMVYLMLIHQMTSMFAVNNYSLEAFGIYIHTYIDIHLPRTVDVKSLVI